jgi:LPXTG-site transpeptidase (sortase) family protein
VCKDGSRVPGATKRNAAIFRFLPRLVSVFILLALLLNVPGVSLSSVSALTTTINDSGPVAIPDAPAGLSCTTSITRNIAVAANVVIADLNIRLNISHTRRSDVRATLTSPAGTTVVLISGAGLGSPVIASPDDFDNYDLILDDTSSGSLYDNDNDNVGGAADRTARPFELLSAYKGQNSVGTWVLTICDTRNGTAGTYNLSTLTFISADPNTISGTVFTDFNDNGVRGTGDTGVSGITVTAYNAAGGVAASAVTNAVGAYSLGVTNGTPVRIEFTGIPASLRPGAFGRDSGTTVQFVTSPGAGVDLGLSSPQDYCQNNPYLVMPCYVNGDPLAGGSAGSTEVLVSIPYSAYGRADNAIEKPLAIGSQIGSTWGLAYQRSTNTVFSAAIAKRHSGLGPLGAGGIYSVVVDPATGNSVSVSPFIDITTIGIPNVGTLPSNAVRGLPAVATTPNADPTAWDAVGKSAIGDMDIGLADDTLWLVNLADQTLYSIFIDIPASIPTAADVAGFPISLPAGATACPAADIRPWAVEVYRGDVYVGVVCSAESTQNVNNLRAYIISTPEGSPGAWTLEFEFGLNYPRGVVSASGSGYPAEWRPWANAFTTLCAAPCTPGLAYGNQIVYPQPILADIEFDTDGDMIIGLMDRAGHQTGEVNYATSAASATYTFYDYTTGYTPVSVTIAANAVFEGTSAGDLLRVCAGGGGFTLENNASCGGITTGGAGSTPAQGPGGGEYYWQDMYSPSTALNGGTHNEVTLGGLVLFPGTDEVATAVFDPFDIRSGGVVWFSNTTGTRTRAFEIFPRTDAANLFGKAAGLGDIEGFCFQAPIEIGNRVWTDSDGDGVQDAGEPPIAGVTVQLFQGATLIATAVTDVNGNYYFSSGPGTTTPSQRYQLNDLDPNENFQIRIPNAQGGSQQVPLAGLILSPNDTDADQRDSDATYNVNDAVISITTGNAGDNNHTYDFGFTGFYSLGNRVWFDTNNNALIDAGEVGVTGVRVELYRDDGTTPGVWDAGDTFLSFDTTDASGYYRFDTLAAGDYVVIIPDDNFRNVGAGDTVPGDPLSGYWSSLTSMAGNGAVTDATANDPDTTVVDSDDNGRSTFAVNTLDYVASAAVTLGPGSTEPTLETDPALNPEPGEAPDNRSDRTVDFGFYRVEIGNIVFEDVNGDGDYDVGTDTPLAGATVRLFASDGVTEIPVGADGILGTADDGLTGVTTGATGVYNFSGLPAGDYIVRVAPPVGYSSTVDTAAPADTADPDTNTDNNDNGIGLAGGPVSSGTLTMIPGEVAANITLTNLTGTTSDPTVDFGFVRAYSLGNRVWFDTDNNSTRDAGELGVDGVLVVLYAADGSGNPTGAALATTTTAGGGYYRFDNLLAGDYVVVIPADNFTANGSNDALVGYWSSGTSRLPNGTLTELAVPDPDANSSDTDDNGTLQNAGLFSGAVLSPAVTLGPGSSEPLNEPDVPGGNQGAQDSRADMTVDFGFYTMTLGDRVWADANDDGLLSGEIGINGVDLILLSGDGTTVIATTTTAGNGNYSFTGLPGGDYLLRIAPAEFNPGGTLEGLTSSSGGGTYEPAPDSDVNTSDNDDNGSVNGILGAGGFIQTEVITLTPGAEATSSNATGTTNEPRVDLGVVTAAYSLGNRVWFDTDNNSTRDVTEVGVNGVIVQLYAADGAGNPTGPVLGTAATAGGGYYRFDNLFAGNYVVVLPADNFTVGGSGDALVGYLSSGTTINGVGVISETPAPDPDNDLDDDDNGTRQTGGGFNGAVISAAVTLGPGASEPTGETDLSASGQGTIDDHANMTVDFGFYRLQLGNLVFEDLDNNGTFSAGDTPIQNAVVTLFAANGTTQILVGADGILGTADDGVTGFTTGAGGTYLFSGLPQGNYIVQVTPPAGYLSTIDSFNQPDNDDPNTNADNNDNGDGILAGTVSSAVLGLIPGGTGALNNNVVTQASGTTNNPTLDFGFVQQATLSGFTKTLLSSNQAFSTDPEVAIGEIVTYRVSLTVPTGVFTNLQLVDTMERGLSFMDCTVINSGTLTTSVPLGFADICANPTVDDAGGGTTTDVRRRVTFNFGTLTNTGTPHPLTIDYRAVVLDSAGNVSGVDLDNSAVWNSDAGSLGPQTTTVTVVEPDVSIVKSSSTSVISVGSIITLTLTIDHTAASETDAYDLIITDPLPLEMDIVPATLDCDAGVQSADVGTCQYLAGTRTITGTWSNFALGGGNAQITFDVTILTIPAAGITNVGTVAWTSLPGIPPSPIGNPPGQQNANIFSTERDYDPGDPINVYGTSSTLVLGAIGGGGGANARLSGIPDTGFAPLVKSDMTGIPRESYNTFADSVWVEIPSLNVKAIIVGVPLRNGDWNVAWLDRQAGWLQGTAFPTIKGNSVVTGHVYLSNGLPGPFVNLSRLKFGETVIVHFAGQKYVYEIRSNRVTSPTDASVFKHDEEAWLTLITCKEYDQETESYRKRVIVRAVLVRVEADK